MRYTTFITRNRNIIRGNKNVFPARIMQIYYCSLVLVIVKIFIKIVPIFIQRWLFTKNVVLCLLTLWLYQKSPTKSLTSVVAIPFFWFLIFIVWSNKYLSIIPPSLYLWVDIGIIFCLYSLVKLLIKTLSFFFVLIHIHF